MRPRADLKQVRRQILKWQIWKCDDLAGGRSQKQRLAKTIAKEKHRARLRGVLMDITVSVSQ